MQSVKPSVEKTGGGLQRCEGPLVDDPYWDDIMEEIQQSRKIERRSQEIAGDRAVKFLLDTNICSAYMRRPGKLAHWFLQFGDQIAIPTIVLTELFAGASAISRLQPTPHLPPA